jgi:nucleoside-diphosphate-sugar epimerase
MALYATGTKGYIGSKLRYSIPLFVDLTDSKTYAQVGLESKSTVIHLAAIVGAQQVLEKPEVAYAVNVDGTIRFAEYLKDTSDTRFLYVSTSHVYKYSESKHTENSLTEPMSLYAKQKLQAEIYLKEVFANEPERLLIARVFSILGESMPEGTLGWAIERASAQNPVRCSDDVRDFHTALEVTQLLERLAIKTWKFQTVNVTSGNSQSVREAGMALRKNLGLSNKEDFFLPGNSKVPQNCGDNTRLRKTLLIKD